MRNRHRPAIGLATGRLDLGRSVADREPAGRSCTKMNGRYGKWLPAWGAWGLSNEAVPASEVNPSGMPTTST